MDIKQYEKYFVYDEPIPYKELLISPVKMKDYLEFHIAINCLLIDKNSIPDPKIISMSYLDFLFYMIDNDTNGQYYSLMLVELLRLCLNLQSEQIKYKYDENNKVKLILNENQIDKDDFEEIKNIILFQNIPTYDDTYIDPEVEKALKDAENFMNKNKKKMASLEDQIVCVMIALHETDETKIHNLTIRKFSKILERYDYKLHYQIYKSAEMGGVVTFKQEIDHWMCDLRKGKYENILMDYDHLDNKISGKLAQQESLK